MTSRPEWRFPADELPGSGPRQASADVRNDDLTGVVDDVIAGR
jgi:hypothetical protein